MRYENYTDTELLNLQPTTELEEELMQRLSGSTEQDWEDLREKLENVWRDLRESNEVVDRLKSAICIAAPTIQHYINTGTLEDAADHHNAFDKFLALIDDYVVYPNSSSSFRAGGEA